MSGTKPGDFDFTRFFADLKFPAIPDMDAFTAATRRNMEALTAANRIALEGAQAVTRREMEIMQQAMSDLTAAMQAVTSTDNPQERAAKQAEALKRGRVARVAPTLTAGPHSAMSALPWKSGMGQ